MLMGNPFQYGAELKPSQIVNRKQEIRDVTRGGHAKIPRVPQYREQDATVSGRARDSSP